ncbi:hypothetical protein SFR_3494 [Streptomyces sp. FR-008]|nr:hypothetical protein SFR_3494 [Streptomyces sp. FR-008]
MPCRPCRHRLPPRRRDLLRTHRQAHERQRGRRP